MIGKCSKLCFLFTCVLGVALAFCFAVLKISPAGRIAFLTTPTEAQEEVTPTPHPKSLPIAKISIPGTAIEEDLFYAQDDFYIDHNRMGEKDYKGEIFMEAPNDMNFQDPVTLIYGHNFHKNSEMFSDLWKYRDKGFFQENPYIYVDQGNKTFVYEIISSYVYDSRNVLASFDFSDVSMQQAYFSYVLHPDDKDACVKETTLIPGKDKLIQLSTCVNMKDTKSNRFLVTGRLLGEQLR